MRTEKKHELAAKDYLLGSLIFSAPALTQTHLLKANDFSTKHLNDGRPPRMTAEVKADLIAKMERWLPEKQATTCTRLTQKHPAVKNYVRELAEKAGVKASDYTLKTQILRPAFRNWRRRN